MGLTTAVVLIGVAFVAGYVIGRSGRAAEGVPPPAPPDRDALDAVRPILAGEGKIAAIKAYRERTGTGLREAKLAVDSLESDAT